MSCDTLFPLRHSDGWWPEITHSSIWRRSEKTQRSDTVFNALLQSVAIHFESPSVWTQSRNNYFSRWRSLFFSASLIAVGKVFYLQSYSPEISLWTQQFSWDENDGSGGRRCQLRHLVAAPKFGRLWHERGNETLWCHPRTRVISKPGAEP